MVLVETVVAVTVRDWQKGRNHLEIPVGVRSEDVLKSRLLGWVREKIVSAFM